MVGPQCRSNRKRAVEIPGAAPIFRLLVLADLQQEAVGSRPQLGFCAVLIDPHRLVILLVGEQELAIDPQFETIRRADANIDRQFPIDLKLPVSIATAPCSGLISLLRSMVRVPLVGLFFEPRHFSIGSREFLLQINFRFRG